MLAAVKPLKTADFAPTSTPMRQEVTMQDSASANLGSLFERHHDRVFRAAYRVTGSAADAEDVLQTVFLRLAKGSEPFVILENPESYFARAAVNASLDLLRARKRSRLVAIDDLENEGASLDRLSPNPASSHEDRELREFIRVAVSKLAPTAGQMFALRYFEGFDNGEIALIMKTSALVVGVTLHRARTRLRKEIGNYLQSHNRAV